MGVEATGSVRHGGCQCGAVRYESTGAPQALYVCHCRECRKQSASAFGISLVVPQSGFRVVRGVPRTWSRPTETLNIKGGSLDQPLDLCEAIHIWTARKLPGVRLPDGATQFPFEPP